MDLDLFLKSELDFVFDMDLEKWSGTANSLTTALIQPHFDYCAPVWDGLSSYLCEKLQKLQNRAARVILQAKYEANSSLLLETLKWDRLSL